MFTLCVNGRRRIFTDSALVDSLIGVLAKAATRHRCSVPVFTFMPDHLHLLARGEANDSDTWAAVSSFHRAVGIHFPEVDFQKDFYDRVIKWFEGWENEAWYIANNPVRAQLVDDPFRWPYTGSIGFDLRDTFGR
jgi:REP element-mobilizing transposase RayT